MTDWEVASKVTIPWVRSGIIGASVLGLGRRALGETMAVALVGGSILHLAPNIFGSMTTIAATILTQLDGAQTDATGFAVATLAELGDPGRDFGRGEPGRPRIIRRPRASVPRWDRTRR